MAPKEWKLSNFQDLNIVTVDGDRGKNYPKKDDYISNGYCLFLGADNITHGNISLKSKTFISKEKHEIMNKGVVQYNDLILVMRGNGTGRVGLYDKEASPYQVARINSGLVILRIDQSKLNKKFMLQLMWSKVVKKQFENYMFGSAQPQLTIKILKSIMLPTPPLNEQDKIATILFSWDKAISTTERLIDNSKQQKKALMQQLLTGKKRLLDDSGKPFDGKWEELNLGSIGTVHSGGTPSTTNKEYWDGDINWITPTDITKQSSVYINSSLRKISSEGLKNSSAKLVPKGSLLVCTRATIGEMAITAHDMCTNQGFKNIIPNKKGSVVFVYYLLNFFKHKLISKASGSTFLELSKSAFEGISFNFPAIEEQHKIASVLTNADQEIEVLEQQFTDLKQEKKALIQQLLTGRRRVSIN